FGVQGTGRYRPDLLGPGLASRRPLGRPPLLQGPRRQPQGLPSRSLEITISRRIPDRFGSKTVESLFCRIEPVPTLFDALEHLRDVARRPGSAKAGVRVTARWADGARRAEFLKVANPCWLALGGLSLAAIPFY